MKIRFALIVAWIGSGMIGWGLNLFLDKPVELPFILLGLGLFYLSEVIDYLNHEGIYSPVQSV